jgi:hypothetical protein
VGGGEGHQKSSAEPHGASMLSERRRGSQIVALRAGNLTNEGRACPRRAPRHGVLISWCVVRGVQAWTVAGLELT